MNRFDELLDLGLAEPRHRRVRSHAAGVRTGVAVADALVVLGGRERKRLVAVGEDEERDLLALDELFDHELVAQRGGSPQAAVQLVLRPAHEDAFAGGEPIGLDNARRPGNREPRGGGDACRLEHVLREGLRALDPRRRAARPEDRDARVAKRVCQARDERRLRADHDEVAKPEQALGIPGADGVALSDAGDPGIPGGGVERLEARALGELPGERMLATPGADDQDPHAPSLLAASARQNVFQTFPARHLFGVVEPGLDRHEWETEWQALEPLVADSPAEALSELDELVERMMAARGLPVAEDAVEEPPEPELLAEFLEARRITRLVESGEAVDPGDVGAAVAGYRNLYARLLEAHLA